MPDRGEPEPVRVDDPDRLEPKQSRSRRTREAVMRAALENFSTSGWRGASVEQIASDAGVSVGLVYTRFRTKKDLMVAVATECISEIDALVPTADELRPDPASALSRLLGVAVSRRRDAAGLLSAWAACAAEHPDLLAQRDAARARLQGGLELLLTSMVGTPGVRDDLDPRMTAVAVTGLLEGIHQPPWTDLDRTEAAQLCARMIGRLIFTDAALTPAIEPPSRTRLR